RKRRGQAVKSKRARKQTRLLTSSAGGASEAEPIDLEQNGTLYFELAVEEIIDFPGEYSGLEVTNLTGDDSVVWEHKEKHPLVSEAADENSPVLPVRDNEQVPVNDDEYVTEKVGINGCSFWICSRLGNGNQPRGVQFAWIFTHRFCERLFLSTLHGHLFCSRCLPVAFETARSCPISRAELTYDDYHPVYV
ncbi:RNF4 ligase, partial [Cephalopterus ornatus]|nr:RNF4 ligase [Cephalopterus ornatus]